MIKFVSSIVFLPVLAVLFACSDNNQVAENPTELEPVSYDRLVVRFSTNLGEIYLWPKIWPLVETADISTQSFLRQVVHGVHNNTLIHRVVPGFLLQGGEFDSSFNSIQPHGEMALDISNSCEHFQGSLALTKTSTNNSPGFFINLDNNHQFDCTTPDSSVESYDIVGQLDTYSRSQVTLSNIVETKRIQGQFEGPTTNFRASTKISFEGNLSTGTDIVTLTDILIYDNNGESRLLSIRFVNNLNYVRKRWDVTVLDQSDAEIGGFQLEFNLNGTLMTGANEFTLTLPPLNIAGGTSDINFYFGEAESYTVTNWSGGTQSSIRVSDVNGNPSFDGNEQPETQIVIEKSELLGRDTTLPNPQQTTGIFLAGTLNPSESQFSYGVEYYIGAPIVAGIDNAGKEVWLEMIFTNQSSLNPNQWNLSLHRFGETFGSEYILTFDSSGYISSSNSIIYLRDPGSFDIRLDISNLLLNGTTASSLSATSIDGNIRWNQYRPVNPAQLEYLIKEQKI